MLDRHPIVSVPEIQKLTGTTYPAANDRISRFEKHGILRKITGQTRNRRFRYDEHVHLFDAE